MLSFLRDNSLKIVVGIIVAFIVTTFMGVVFNDSFKTTTDQNQIKNDLRNSIAIIGDDIPVLRQVYSIELRRAQSSIPETPKLLPV